MYNIRNLCYTHLLSDGEIVRLRGECTQLACIVHCIARNFPEWKTTPWLHIWCFHLPQFAAKWRTVRHFMTLVIDAKHGWVRRSVHNTWKGSRAHNTLVPATRSMAQAINHLNGDFRLVRLGFSATGLGRLIAYPQQVVEDLENSSDDETPVRRSRMRKRPRITHIVQT